jgi:hypothetical protein
VATPGMSLQGRPQRLQLLPKQWLHRTSSRTRVTLLRTLRQSISLSLLLACPTVAILDGIQHKS